MVSAVHHAQSLIWKLFTAAKEKEECETQPSMGCSFVRVLLVMYVCMPCSRGIHGHIQPPEYW